MTPGVGESEIEYQKIRIKIRKNLTFTKIFTSIQWINFQKSMMLTHDATDVMLSHHPSIFFNITVMEITVTVNALQT